MIDILIVDDQDLIRDGLRAIFDDDPDLRVVGEAADGSDALRLNATLRPHVVLMDLRMPGMDGITATSRTVQTDTPPYVLVLTTYDSDDTVLAALQAGASGYLLKTPPRPHHRGHPPRRRGRSTTRSPRDPTTDQPHQNNTDTTARCATAPTHPARTRHPQGDRPRPDQRRDPTCRSPPSSPTQAPYSRNWQSATAYKPPCSPTNQASSHPATKTPERPTPINLAAAGQPVLHRHPQHPPAPLLPPGLTRASNPPPAD
jgi:CheY-like chemotaxis protein